MMTELAECCWNYAEAVHKLVNNVRSNDVHNLYMYITANIRYTWIH